MENLTCLLIDDDEDDRDIFELAIQNANDTFKCLTASGGNDAFDLLNANAASVPDFIFIDLNMPYMSGKECLNLLKKDARFATIPVVIYTTSSYDKDINEVQQLGAVHFLVKPSSVKDLTYILSEILKKAPLPYYLEATVS